MNTTAATLDNPALRPLLAAGKTLATLAEPVGDLVEIMSKFSELEFSIQLIWRGIDRVSSLDPTPEEDLAAREGAARAAKRVLVSLASVIEEIEESVVDMRKSGVV